MASDVAQPDAPAARGSTLLRVVFGVWYTHEVRGLLPGVLLAVLVMAAALPLADAAGGVLLRWQRIEPAGRVSPVSGVLVAVLLGALLRNLLPLPTVTRAGVQFCITKVLRLGIILIGLKLSLIDIGRLGAWGLPVVVGTILAGFLLIAAFNRLLGLPPELGALMAAGTSICGITAIVSTAAAIRAPQREVAYAVANITLFGLLAMLAYPHLAPMLLRTPEQIGMFFGTAIHDTSQVVGAALMYKELHADDAAFKAATVTKLTRNLFLAAVVPLAALMYARSRPRPAQGDGSSRRAAGPPALAEPPKNAPVGAFFPLFVVGFLALAIVRTLGDATLNAGGRALGVFEAGRWQWLTAFLAETIGSRYALGTALAAVGLGTSLSVFRSVGLKPLVVGLVGALLVGLTGLLLAATLGQHVRL